MTRKWSGFGSELGRSMIEMLGVLAIVGVLSIGGIAGFQKAMNKHKINQVTEEFSGFINELLRYSKDWRRIGFAGEAIRRDLTSEIDFILPGKWRREESFIYDSMGNKFVVYLRKDWGAPRPMLNLSYRFSNQDNKVRENLCMAYYDMIKPYADSVWMVMIWRIWRQDSDASQSTLSVYGNAYCDGKTKKCLRDLTLNEIREKCSVYKSDDENSSFSIFLPL